MTNDPFPPSPARATSSGVVAVRLKGDGRKWLDEKIEQHQITQTEVVKAALAFAASNAKQFDKIITERKERL